MIKCMVLKFQPKCLRGIIFFVERLRYSEVIYGRTSICRNARDIQTWIIERLDRKLADAIGSNIVGKCDVTLSTAIQTHSTFCASFYYP